MPTRREALKKIVDGGKYLGLGGLLWGLASHDIAEGDVALRPPGASAKDADFVQACTKCGKCVEACPYDTLMLGGPGDSKVIGTPYFKPREIPCYMCEDVPCAVHCPSGALDMKRLAEEGEPSINNAHMGLAVVHKESCLAHWGIQCDVCYRECPLMDKAIRLKKEINQVTQKHANVVPVVDSDYCTGCGICEKVCVTEKAAIFVLPRNMVTGKMSDHYIRRQQKAGKRRVRNKDVRREGKDDVESGLEYLNE